jgi:Bacteriocin-protection, YdeI or OmpD-Associated/Domain of unknown function (DUF1905)
MAARVRFRAILQATPGGGGGSYVEVPDDAVETLDARRRTSVQATIDGVPYAGQVMPYTFEGREKRVVLGITKAIRAEAGKAIGDELAIELERDDRSRSESVEVPTELADALASDEAAAAAWASLAPSHRREHARHVAEAKREETRRRRAIAVVDQLRGG